MTNQKFPKACEKQLLYKILVDIPERELRQITNKTIAKNRGLPYHIAKFKRSLRKNEVRLVMEFFGYLEPEETT